MLECGARDMPSTLVAAWLGCWEGSEAGELRDMLHRHVRHLSGLPDVQEIKGHLDALRLLSAFSWSRMALATSRLIGVPPFESALVFKYSKRSTGMLMLVLTYALCMVLPIAAVLLVFQ